MDLFRAVVQLDERSKRAFDLTTAVLECNAANYTAWYYRAILIHDLKLDPTAELEFVAGMAEDNAKNYQIWYAMLLHTHTPLQNRREKRGNRERERGVGESLIRHYCHRHHRRLMLEELGDKADGVAELAFTTQVLEDDEDQKNYHAWAHRQWVLKTFQLWDGEIAFVESLLQRDRRNNSAWNQRYFVLQSTRTFDDALIQQEIEYV
jgi:protein farnesyltransferase/geranylgeranyltransferase type-1 subunit alpha